MVPEEVCREKLTTLALCLPSRDGSAPESDLRTRTYYRQLGVLERDDFVEACDRILYTDEWFPTISRIRTVASECADARRRSSKAIAPAGPRLVCATCHGARWVRLGGFDPSGMQAGETGSRVQACPKCMTVGSYDGEKETWTIQNEGGIYDPNGAKEIDMSRVTWPAQLAALRNPLTGRVDMGAMYRLSREMRNLDPTIDERPTSVGGWQTIGSAAGAVPMATGELD